MGTSKYLDESGFNMITCPVCHKKFLKPPQVVYKIYVGDGRYRAVCSWSCVRRHESSENNKPIKKYVKRDK